MKKTCIALIVLVALLSMLTACGKQADDPAGADSTSTDAITSVSANGTACRVDVRKNYGGQETGQMDGSNVIVDLSEEVPVIIVRADAMDTTRCYHLTVE